MAPKPPDLSHLARPGAEIALRVTPKAARDRITDAGPEEEGLRVYTTATPQDGKANDAVRRMLAKALGVPPTSLRLIRGQKARDKVFRLD
ncbi:DUF167 domain-containing protein [Pseudooceanicola algae]|uniref:UPF0235 protein PSAL_033520 n=1 Tax=Pseudooceanicola algae TaxID=1537215 RepID=A0A418SHX6_9RHOB|nr:DUF167 domain-containing protein [Pseudooceanicola algae]QPM92089.1 hypothetical protein PSAL_033520 [Pseudooceanicola algae]